MVHDAALKHLRRIRQRAAGAHAARAYSQEGEDLILMRLFERQRRGYYVDVGAHHPSRFSNTFVFYQRGWNGLVIDPLPGTRRAFRRWRPRDEALEIAIGLEECVRTYFMFDEPAVNTFDPQAAERLDRGAVHHLLGTLPVAVRTLGTILAEKVPAGVEIDILSVDVEGLDFEVLQSNDWSSFRPRTVCFELSRRARTPDTRSPSEELLEGEGYCRLASTINSLIYATPECLAETGADTYVTRAVSA